nr:hypothetical protein [Marinicella sp. W31]MDC2876608.1 hypothetical protein [Marinicella sp. W31]
MTNDRPEPDTLAAPASDMAQPLDMDRLDLDPIAASVLALALLEEARDSRTAARHLSIAHALALRAVTTLLREPCLIEIIKRDARTSRIFTVQRSVPGH